MKKTISALMLTTALAASPASAHLTDFKFINVPFDYQWSMTPGATGVTITRKSDGYNFGAPFSVVVTPSHSTVFRGVFEGSTPAQCEYWVAIHQLAGPDINSRVTMNVCTQRTIYLRSGLGVNVLNPVTFGP